MIQVDSDGHARSVEIDGCDGKQMLFVYDLWEGRVDEVGLVFVLALEATHCSVDAGAAIVEEFLV